MASDEQLTVIRAGVKAWNEWRETHRRVAVELQGADLTKGSLRAAALFTRRGVAPRTNLRDTVFASAHLARADLYDADMTGSYLVGANLQRAKLEKATLAEADLTGANLSKADLRDTDLRGAVLRGANLQQAQLVRTKLDGADLTAASVYGISVWNVSLVGAIQSNLIVTPDPEPPITVDNLEVAQFVYLLLDNRSLRHVIDTITTKVVLILGRFKPERKAVLDALRDALRQRDYLPVLFDFEKPAGRDTVETVSTLAHLARFVIADLTDAKSVLQELQRIVPDLPSVAIQPIILSTQHEPGMIDHFKNYVSFLPLYRYASPERLLLMLDTRVIDPAERWAKRRARKESAT